MLLATANPSWATARLVDYAHATPVWLNIVIALSIVIGWTLAYIVTQALASRDDDDVRQWSVSVYFSNLRTHINQDSGFTKRFEYELLLTNIAKSVIRTLDVKADIPYRHSDNVLALIKPSSGAITLAPGQSAVFTVVFDGVFDIKHQELNKIQTIITVSERQSTLSRSFSFGDEYIAAKRKSVRGRAKAGDARVRRNWLLNRH